MEGSVRHGWGCGVESRDLGKQPNEFGARVIGTAFGVKIVGKSGGGSGGGRGDDGGNRIERNNRSSG